MKNEINNIKITICTDNGVNTNSIYTSDSHEKTVGFIGSPLNPYGEYGWFKMIHEVILNSSFELPKIVTKDATEIIKKHHNIKQTEPSKYNKDVYLNELFEYVVDEFSISDVVSDEISELMGKCEPIIYCELRDVMGSSNQIPSIYSSFKEFTNRMCVDGITFYIHTMADNNDYYGMCIYYPDSGEIFLTFDPLAFFNEMESGHFLFAGEINVKEYFENGCIEVSDKLITVMNQQVAVRIGNFENSHKFDTLLV